MRKIIFYLLLLPLLVTGQQPLFQNVFAGPVGSLQGYGITAGATFNTGLKWTGQLKLEAVHPLVTTAGFYEGEKWVNKKPFALVSVGADMLLMPASLNDCIARTYGIAGWSVGLFPLNGFAQAGAGINSRHLDVALLYREGFGHYKKLSGWHLRIVKPFSLQ